MKKLGILLISVIALAGCSAGQGEKKTANSEQTSTSKTSSSQSQRVAAPTTIKVSVNTAIKKLHQQFGQDVALSELSLERESGQYQYEVSGLDNSREYEVTLDARSGKILRHDQEKLDQDEANGVARNRDAIAVNRLKALTDISKAAEKHAGSGTAIKWSLEHDNGQVQWDVKVQQNQQTQEVAVNAYTAKVVTTHQDDDDDNED